MDRYTLHIVIVSVCGAATLICMILMAKNCNTLEQQLIIGNAIYRYNIRHLDTPIPYTVVEPYARTLFRVWDWGHMRIVDPDTYEKIKPYIQKKRWLI